jgi:hypothetical protein
MATRKYVCPWSTGSQGGAGISTFYSAFGTDMTSDLNTFWNAVKAVFSDEVTVSVPSSGDVFDETTGTLTGAWTAGTAGSYSGSSHGAYPAGTGAFIKWNTGTVIGGHRVKGRTFIAPILAAGFDVNGTLAGGYLTIIQNAATTLAGSGKMLVWHRPTTSGGSDGATAAVVSATVPDKTTSLASRRH